MRLIGAEISHNPVALERILSVHIGIDNSDSDAVTEEVAKLIQLELKKVLMPEVVEKLRRQLPSLVAKVGPEITIAGIKQLVK